MTFSAITCGRVLKRQTKKRAFKNEASSYIELIQSWVLTLGKYQLHFKFRISVRFWKISSKKCFLLYIKIWRYQQIILCFLKSHINTSKRLVINQIFTQQTLKIGFAKFYCALQFSEQIIHINKSLLKIAIDIETDTRFY